MDNKQALTKIAENIENCQRCDLYKTANHAVPGRGNPQAKIVFIGEAPGFYEDAQGEPFVGNAGKYLNTLLTKVGLTREDVFITNIVKHRPPENRDPTFGEIAACNGWLEMQLKIISPPLVVTLGKWSLNYFLPDKKISQVHGIALRVGQRSLLPMYHPAAALRNGQIAAQLQEDFLKNKGFFQNPQELSGKDLSEEDGQGSLF